jgi:NAD(P)-dependent dehydrogenase (short-subunit alcohol dehydrogenase family)
MVKYRDIHSANTSYFSSDSLPSNLTAVFVGATSGIGNGTLRALLKHTAATTPPTSPTVYLLGRSQSTLSPQVTELQKLNPAANLIAVEAGDLSVVSNAKKAADKIIETANKVDLLIMSPGYISMKRVDNGEGVDRCTALRHYSRTQILLTLAPLLRKAEKPRVVTVLAGGKEGAVDPADWLFKTGYGPAKVADATGSYVSLTLEEFAKQPGNDKISLIHLFPGLVSGTGIHLDGAPFWLKWLGPVATLFLKLVGYSTDESGERVLYAATSSHFPSAAEGAQDGAEKGSNGSVGSGVYLIDADNSAIAGNATLTGHRAKEIGEKIYSHTVKVLSDIETAGHTE